MYKINLLILLLFTIAGNVCSQTIIRPNYGLKSHPTLEIESVVIAGNVTTLNLVIENRSLEGTFCADKDIFITLPDGKRMKIKETTGIPRCPETYVFKNYGEKLYFTLIFPGLPEGTEWFDLTEDCEDACFSFNSVILDAGLNRKIDEAFLLLESKKTEEANSEFENLLNYFAGKKCSYEGAVYCNLITIARQTGNTRKEADLFEKLKLSDIPLKEKFIESLVNAR